MSIMKKIRIILLIVAGIAFIVGLSITGFVEQEQAHNIEDIYIDITNSKSKYSNSTYYVYMDFRITNKTSATLDFVKVTAYFTDRSGNLIGTTTAELGSPYDDRKLNISTGSSGTRTMHISKLKSDTQDEHLFVELYNHGLQNVTVTYEITYAEWSDGYSRRGKQSQS